MIPACYTHPHQSLTVLACYARLLTINMTYLYGFARGPLVHYFTDESGSHMDCDVEYAPSLTIYG